jgi:hypothetical protein
MPESQNVTASVEEDRFVSSPPVLPVSAFSNRRGFVATAAPLCAGMKRLFQEPLACLLALAIAGAAVWCSLLYGNHGSLGFRCGLLAAGNDPYLDGSGKVFQKCSSHLGNGTHTWGETYGFKVRRLYVSMEIGHTNPRVTPREAREDE